MSSSEAYLLNFELFLLVFVTTLFFKYTRCYLGKFNVLLFDVLWNYFMEILLLIYSFSSVSWQEFHDFLHEK